MKVSVVPVLAVLVASLFSWTAGAGWPGPGWPGPRWNGRIVDVRSGETLALRELGERLAGARYVVLAEKHYTESVQRAQAAVIRAASPAEGFVTAWEFLDASNRSKTEDAFGRFVVGLLDAPGFLREVHGPGGDMRGSPYIPILEATRDLGGKLIGVNLSRQEKAPVVRGGIGAADPRLVPPGYSAGGAGYRERFERAMEGHASPGQIANYYDAQCLTDDVMAWHLTEERSEGPRFLAVGSFHADYRDGVVSRIRVRDPGAEIRVVRWVDAADHTEDELENLVRHAVYGELADFVFYVNEPPAR